jgi:hypothetical protein
VLGPSYASSAGAEIGRLVVVLSPWAVATVGISVTVPLLFVHGPRLVAADRIAVSLAITTGLILVVMLTALGSARRVPTGLAVASAIVGAFALVAYLPP